MTEVERQKFLTEQARLRALYDQAVTDAKARTLKEMNCVSISIGVETGNEEYRINSLKKRIASSSFSTAYPAEELEELRNLNSITNQQIGTFIKNHEKILKVCLDHMRHPHGMTH